ncbi:G-type lectin S-receptor-like serine/threonine-protein kinase LECRK3 isoform X1 [Telopea speciosissima]|uniref:G-type lectin S-receptor-like serine/threonine-protein kinase LECRK3 isoform X1 n=1 Tax=Telopea speciosissima TaxID=54955 RepID=UPI001CC7BF27|nr:G-type lectin S-receptor-like serine/threonine-protein kinase LECRK3 isoform X1 [Telopea speciosissima]
MVDNPCHGFSLLLLLLPLLPFSTSAQTNSNVSLGESLSAGSSTSSWLSPSGEFAFGFQAIKNTDDAFLLAIWYEKIPEKTIVWYANGDKPVPRGSKVQLTINGDLKLNNPQGEEIWRAQSILGVVTYAAMLDTGNFVLVDRSSDHIWESFKNPSDTILPSQILELGSTLSSRQPTNYSRGRFQLRPLADGNLVLNTVFLPTNSSFDPYYVSNTGSSGYQVVFNGSTAIIYIQSLYGSIVSNLTVRSIPSTKTHYHRATIDFNGVFTQYARPKSSSSSNDYESWSIVWCIPDDICSHQEIGEGICGFNSICRIVQNRPVCKCPDQYTLDDPNNTLSGCKPDFILQGCHENQSGSPDILYRMNELLDTDWPGSADYQRLTPYSEAECQDACLYDCQCAMSTLLDSKCWKKSLPFRNGRQKSDLIVKAYLKVSSGNPPPVPVDDNPRSNSNHDVKEKDQGLFSVAAAVLLGSSIFVNFLFLSAIFMVVLMYHKKLKEKVQKPSSFETNLHSFSYKDLTEATDGFKEELGRGAFGVVYKGVLDSKLVAVKKLGRVVQEGDKEFKTELRAIGQTHHKNLVKLVGFCEEGQHRLLVYEFMSNGSLASFLFGSSSPDWYQRTQIAYGIARGLMYLHEECSIPVIHCDIKPQNTLLDDSYTARISDFGLAKLLMTDQSRTRTAIRGTKGYVAPEWFRHMPITVKVDVYSFGVMLMEIICCRKNVELEMGGDERAILTDWADDCYQEGRLDALVENDMEAMNDMGRLEKLLKVAIWCIQEEPSLRPTMRKVVQMLEGIVEVSVPPHPYLFISVVET